MKYLSDEDIYEFYLGEKVSFRRAFVSPFREESHPSLTFMRTGEGRVLWRDWGDSLQSKSEGAMAFVMRLFNCSFKDALRHLEEDLGGESKSIAFYKRPYPFKEEKKRSDIQIKSRLFDENDTSYWSQYGISIDTLNRYNVVPIQQWYYNYYPQAEYDGVHPIFAYRFSKDGNIFYKIYNPLSEDRKKKWRYNGGSDIIMGYDQLPLHGDLLIITKSLKDIMTLYEMGYNAVSLQSEMTVLTTDVHALLKRRFDNLIVLYDNDATGMSAAQKISSRYGIPSISIPEDAGKGIKDISDYVAAYGIEKGKMLMRKLLDNIKEV